MLALVPDSPPANGHTPTPDGGLREVASQVVAVLFAASSPLTLADLARVLQCDPLTVSASADWLQAHPPTGLAVLRHEDALNLTTAPSAAAVVERFFGAPPPVRLSRAALEALAVIAYRQPVTRGEIDAVRGVNSDSAVTTLLNRGLVAEVGRRETVGRPTLLATTPDFLQYLGVPSLDELPSLPGAVPAPAETAASPDPPTRSAAAPTTATE